MGKNSKYRCKNEAVIVVYADSSTTATEADDKVEAQFRREWNEEKHQEIPKFERDGTVKYLHWKSCEEERGKLDEKVNSMDKKVDSVDKKVDSVDKKVDSVGKKVDNMEKG